MKKWLAALLLATAISAPSVGRNYDHNTDPAIVEWFRSLYQPDLGVNSSCCGVADAYYADEFEDKNGQYVAIITDERDIQGRPNIKVGTRVPVPPNKVKTDEQTKTNPTGHGIIFVSSSTTHYDGNLDIEDARYVFCYLPPVMN